MSQRNRIEAASYCQLSCSKARNSLIILDAQAHFPRSDREDPEAYHDEPAALRAAVGYKLLGNYRCSRGHKTTLCSHGGAQQRHEDAGTLVSSSPERHNRRRWPYHAATETSSSGTPFLQGLEQQLNGRLDCPCCQTDFLAASQSSCVSRAGRDLDRRSGVHARALAGQY